MGELPAPSRSGYHHIMFSGYSLWAYTGALLCLAAWMGLSIILSRKTGPHRIYEKISRLVTIAGWSLIALAVVFRTIQGF